MISIIISSYRQSYFSALEQNIEETIGVGYEIIKIDNPGIMGISEAYNTGASKAKYPYLCFVHEDVKFHTKNWGVNLINHFLQDKMTGVIGIAGSIYKTKVLSSWWQPIISGIEPKRTNYIQFDKKTTTSSHMLLNPQGESRSAVATLDGVFLATRKEVWAEILFDQNLLKGFHGYDLDFTLRAANHFNNYVIYDNLLEHFSEGIIDVNWVKQNLLVHKKNKNILPITKNVLIDLNEIKRFDKSYLARNLEILESVSYNKLDLVVIFIQLIINSRMYKPNIKVLKFFFNLLLSK